MSTGLPAFISLSNLFSSFFRSGASQSLRRRLPFAAAAVSMLLFFVTVSLQAQSYSGGQNTRALITQPIAESKLVSLPGNTHPAAIPANDRGAVSDSLPLEHLQLQLQRPPELEQKLEKFMAEQQRQGSPVFHRWLTADQFGQRFGVSPQDIEKIIDVTGNASDFSSHLYCAGTLGPKKGHSCTIGVAFSPSALISEGATLNIVTNAPGSPVQVPITGAGIAGPKCKTQ
jgi:Pro-kumamolisin, activation domain